MPTIVCSVVLPGPSACPRGRGAAFVPPGRSGRNRATRSRSSPGGCTPADSWPGLAVGVVAAGHQHRGERRLALRQVEQGRDMVVGPALVDDPFDAVAVAVDGADDARLERRLVGQVAERLEELALQLSLPPRQVVRCLQGSHRSAAGFKRLTRLRVQIFQ